MAEHRVSVTVARPGAGELPEGFSEFVILWQMLDQPGVIDQVAERLELKRKDGCCGLEVFAQLLAMWTSGAVGQRALERASEGHGAALAAAAGLRRWVSQASLSRGLASVEEDQGLRFSQWLLSEAMGVSESERDSSTFYYDAFGQPWRLVDVDGRVKAFRQRGLPQGPDLPEAQRRAEGLARPGYPGRKRGEVQLHEMIVQDAGTGRFPDVRLAPGNGQRRVEMDRAAQVAAHYGRALGPDPSRVVLRYDGESAGEANVVGSLRAGVAMLSRWCDYGLLSEPRVAQWLAEAAWQEVEDSGSGPRRWAAELGQRLLAGQGVGGESLPVRLVVSRFASPDGQRHGAGVVIGQWQYEQYITVLPAPGWPAGQLVKAYYHRTGQENRFCQKDRELGRSRLISAHLAGQQVATAVGLLTWNRRLLAGAQVMGMKPRVADLSGVEAAEWASLAGAARPEPEGAPSESVQPSPAVSSRAEQPGQGTEPGQRPAGVPGTACPQTAPREPGHSTKAPAAQAGPPPPVRPAIAADRGGGADGRQDQPAASSRVKLWLALLALLGSLAWPELLSRLAGWRWGGSPGALHCPADQPMRLHRVRTMGQHTYALHFRLRHRSACHACPNRAQCTSSTQPNFSKELALTIDQADLGEPGLLAALATARRRRGSGARRPPSAGPATGAESDCPNRPARPSPPAVSPRWQLPPPDAAPPGTATPQPPTLVPSVLRSSLAALMRGCRVSVVLQLPRPDRRCPPWLAPTDAQRQHRRLSRTARLSKRLLAPGSAVELTISAPAKKARALRRLLRCGITTRSAKGTD
jgi:hypothetical protein